MALLGMACPAQAQDNAGNNNPNVGPGNNNGNGGNNGNGDNNGSGGGGGNVNPSSSPPTPYVAEFTYLTPDTTTEIEVLGQAGPGEAFVASRGNQAISASFSHSGITVNSITVNSDTSLTLTITVASGATLGGASLTITNPNGDSATSSGNVVAVTDIPEILAATVSPTPPSVIEDLEATIIAYRNQDPSIEVAYQYQWYEDGAPSRKPVAFCPPRSPVRAAATTR